MDLPLGPNSSSGKFNMDHSTPWPRNLYFHIKRREWRARYIYQGKKRMKNFSLKRYSCEASLILGAHFLREMRRRRIPSDSEIAAWDSELRAVLPQFQCNAFEPNSKCRKTSESNPITPYKSKSMVTEGELGKNLPDNNNASDVIMHYHAPVLLPGKNDSNNTYISNATANQNAFATAMANGKPLANKILEKIPHKFKDAIHDINKLICIASQSVPYIPLGGVFTPDPKCPLKLMTRKRSKTTSGSEPDDFEGFLLKNEYLQDHLSPSNLQDDYFNVCHTLNQLSQECSGGKQEKPEFKESDFYTYQVVDEKIAKTTSVGKMPSIYHRLRCATNTISTLNKWHNVRITLDKNIRKQYTSDRADGLFPLYMDTNVIARNAIISTPLNANSGFCINQKNIVGDVKSKKVRKRDDLPESTRIRHIGISEFCSLVSNVIRQVESNLETISQMSKCPALLDDPRMYIKQSLNSSIPNFPSITNSTCGLEKNFKLKTDQDTTNSSGATNPIATAKTTLSDSDHAESDTPPGNYRMPISSIYNVNNSLYDYVNSSRYLPKTPIALRESVVDCDSNYATRLFKHISPPNNNTKKITSPSNLNLLCSSGLLALINQAQYTMDPEELASIILSAMMINHQQSVCP